MFIKDYIKKQNLIFVSLLDEFHNKNYFGGTEIVNVENFIYLPLQYSDRYFGGSCMEAKYKMVDMKFDNWQKHLIFDRNKEKEDELYYNILKLRDDSEYTLLSKTWGTQPNYQSKDVYYEDSNHIVELSFIDNFTLFDWSKVIENAKQISIVDTSVNYLVETLNVTAEKFFLSSRFTPPNFSHIINLFKTNWIKIEK
jgi:hypothetical protein